MSDKYVKQAEGHTREEGQKLAAKLDETWRVIDQDLRRLPNYNNEWALQLRGIFYTGAYAMSCITAQHMAPTVRQLAGVMRVDEALQEKLGNMAAIVASAHKGVGQA
jgi:hypothetical protein